MGPFLEFLSNVVDSRQYIVGAGSRSALPSVVFLPAILVGAFAICAISPQPLWQVCASVLTFVVLLQLSYVGGALLRFATSGGVTADVPAELARARTH